MSVTLAPPMFLEFMNPNNSGSPATGFLLFTYVAGTSTKQSTWTDSTQTTTNPNPIVLDANGAANIWGDPQLAYKFVLAPANDTDPPTSPIRTQDNLYFPVTINTTFAKQTYPLTPSESAAHITPNDFTVTPFLYTAPRYGVLANNVNDDTQALNNAIAVASQPIGNATGAVVSLATGTSLLSSTINLPNRVTLRGQNKLGSYFQALTAFNGSWMFHAFNGTTSMFDSRLELLTVDANNLAGLGCVLSDAWQENSGLRNVLLLNFSTSAIKFQNGYGGAALCKVADLEIFGGTTASAIGIDLTSPIGGVAAFMLDVSNATISGAPSVGLAAGISCKGNSLLCRSVHFEYCTSGVLVDGNGYISLDDLTGGPSVTSLVTVAATFTGTLVMKNCRRNTATNFVNDLRTGGYGAYTSDQPFFVINALDSTSVAKGSAFCSAWCIFNGTTTGTNAPTAGYNVTSVTRNSAGNYTVTLTRPLVNSNAAVIASQNNANSGWQIATAVSSTLSVGILTGVSGTPTDSTEIKVVIFGG